MPVGNDGGEKRRENLVSSFLKSRIDGGNDGGLERRQGTRNLMVEGEIR